MVVVVLVVVVVVVTFLPGVVMFQRRLHKKASPARTLLEVGTLVVETAVTSFAPSFAMPPASYFWPTMKPEIFCRKTRGILRWLHSSMKCAPFNDDSENRIPLFATIPTG